VVNVVDCSSGGGESAQLRHDQCGGGVIGAAAGSGGGVDLAQGRSADVGEAS
jgi:hypothetical protein